MKREIFFALFFFISSLVHSAEYEDTLFPKQWAIKNKGQLILKDNSEFSRDYIRGTVGVDINYYNPKSVDENSEVVVAVIDSGVDVNHPDLKGRIYYNKKICAENQSQNQNEDENKNSDNSKKPCYGINAMDKNLDISDDHGHGTHIAGIISANKNNIGMMGVAPRQVKIMPIKVFNSESSDYIYNKRYVTDIFADAIIFAIRNGAHVINMSLGFPKLIRTPKFVNALKKALEKDVPVIVAAGNNNKDLPVYPCSSKGVICVGAITNTGKIAEFSNFGGKVDILAPGDFIVSTYPVAQCPVLMANGSTDPCLKQPIESRLLRIFGNEAKKGTSQAAPFIAGIVATMKLVNPNLSLNQIKARLYSTARDVKEATIDNKFSKFGLVDMKRAILENIETYIVPDYKSLTDIEVDSKNRKFSFELPIDNLIRDEEDVNVKVEISSDNIKLDKSEFIIKNFKKDSTQKITVEGEILDMSLDAYQKMTVSIGAKNNKMKETMNNIIFNTGIKQSNEIKKVSIKGVHVKKMAIIDPRLKRLFLRKVSNQFKLDAGPEYYILDRSKQSKTKTVITLMEMKEKEVKVRDLTLNKQDRVISIFRADIDQNGSIDYFVYSINSEKDHIIFSMYDKKLRPLFKGKNIFEFPITSRWELPMKNTYEEDFFWMKIKTEDFGSILVPAVYTNALMPEEDNSDDILDRIPNVRANHLYYHLPKIEGDKVKVSLRVVDSYNLREKIKELIDIEFYENMTFERPFHQSKEDYLQGKLTTLVSKGEEISRIFYQLKFDENFNIELKPLDKLRRFISGNNLFPIYDLNNNLNKTEDNVLIALNNRISSRLFYMDDREKERYSFELNTGKWSDPIFNFLGIFNDVSNTLLIESRYYIHGYSQYGKQKLLIYRESSFPGVKFSETMEPVSVQADDRKLPAMFIDSTLIFGDRLYTIISDDEGIKRPISLSIQVPPSCIRMRPDVDRKTGVFHYLMLCGNKNGSAYFLKYPIRI